jgi:hypothetical protein
MNNCLLLITVEKNWLESIGFTGQCFGGVAHEHYCSLPVSYILDKTEGYDELTLTFILQRTACGASI